MNAERLVNAIDPIAVTEILRRHLPSSVGDSITVRDRGIKLTHSHKAQLCVCYYLHKDNGLTDPHIPPILYGKIFDNDPTDRYEIRPLSLLSFPHSADNQPYYLSELGMFVWPFPSDPTLSQLPQLCEGEHVRNFIPYSDPTQQQTWQWREDLPITIHPVSYHPENRCTIRYEFGSGTDTNSPPRLTMYGKTFNDDRGRHLYSRLKTLWKWSQETPDSFLVPRPCRYDEIVKTVWEEGLTGQALIDVITPNNLPDLMSSVAKCLASFHRSELALPPGAETKLLFEEFKKKTLDMTQAFPNVRDALTSVLSDMEPLPVGLVARAKAPVHGSFRIGELLSCGSRIGTCDLDNCCLGDPLQDLAYFFADLHFCGIPPALRDQLAVAFCQAYQIHIDIEVPLSHITWHYQLRLLRKAYWIYQKQSVKPGTERRILKVLQLANNASVFIDEILHANPTHGNILARKMCPPVDRVS